MQVITGGGLQGNKKQCRNGIGLSVTPYRTERPNNFQFLSFLILFYSKKATHRGYKGPTILRKWTKRRESRSTLILLKIRFLFCLHEQIVSVSRSLCSKRGLSLFSCVMRGAVWWTCRTSDSRDYGPALHRAVARTVCLSSPCDLEAQL